MKISVSNIAWDVSEDGAATQLLLQNKIDGIEIALTKIWSSPLQTSDIVLHAYAQNWRKQGIQLTAVQSVLFGRPDLSIFGDKQTREKTLKYIEEIIRISAVLGVKVIVFGSPKSRQIHSLNQNEVLKIALPFFTRLGDVSKTYHVQFCLEPNSREYGNEFITNTVEAVDFIKLVDHPNLGMNLDLGVMTLNREPYSEMISFALPHTKHIHISEPFLNPIDTVHTPHSAISELLKSLGYSGWVSLEMKESVDVDHLKKLADSISLLTSFYR